QGRLAAPRRPDDGQEGLLFYPGDEILDEQLATEEDARVLLPERDEPLVRAGDVGGRERVVGQPCRGRRLLVGARRREAARETVDDQLVEELRLGEVLQPVSPKLPQTRRGG